MGEGRTTPGKGKRLNSARRAVKKSKGLGMRLKNWERGTHRKKKDEVIKHTFEM